MANLKIAKDQHLESQEINRLKSFIKEDGYEKLFSQFIDQFGIPKQPSDNNWTNFLVEQGTSAGTVKVNSGLAIDSSYRTIVGDIIDNIVLDAINTNYYIKISHKTVNYERGTVSVSSDGSVLGTGTSFLEVIRGIPNIPSYVRFLKADGTTANNSGTYIVNNVTDDTNLNLGADILSGQTISAESGLKIIVVGSFTAGATIDAQDKDIYEYDSVQIDVEEDDTVTDGEQFILAEVSKDGSNNVSIKDYRTKYIFKSSSFYELYKQWNSPLTDVLGIESIKYGSQYSDRRSNILSIGWGLRVANWQPSDYKDLTRRFAFVGSQNLGGKIKTYNDFSDNVMDGWRMYAPDGKYYLIDTSYPDESANGYYFEFANIDEDSFVDNTKNIVVVPDADFIEFEFTPSLGSPNEEYSFVKREMFPIEQAVADIHLPLYNLDTNPTYTVKYRLKSKNYSSTWYDLPSDVTNGYYSEPKFNANGSYNTGGYTTYASNNITLIRAQGIRRSHIIDLPPWNMQGTVIIGVIDDLGVKSLYSAGKNPTIYITITADNGALYDFNAGGLWSAGNTFGEIDLIRDSSGVFDSSSFSGTFYSRGKIRIEYDT